MRRLKNNKGEEEVSSKFNTNKKIPSLAAFSY